MATPMGMGWGATVVVAENLKLDTVDGTVENVFSKGNGEFQYLTDVDQYMYQSLKTIWMSKSKTPNASYITSIWGDGTTNTQDGTIVVTIPSDLEASEASRGFRTDFDGAEYSVVDVKFVKPPNLTMNSVSQAALRTRYVLDGNCRQYLGLPPDLYTRLPSNPQVKFDKTIMDTYFRCFHKGELVDPTKSEITSRYIVQYIRLFTYLV